MSVVPATMRPVNTPQLLDRAVRVFRDNFKTFFGIVAIAQIPVILINALLGGSSIFQQFTLLGAAASGEVLPTAAGPLAGVLALPASFVSSLLTQLGNAALCWAVVNSLLGTKVTVGDAYRQLRRRWQSVVGVWFLGGLAIIGLAIWWIVACVIGWFTGLGMIIFFTYVIIPLALVAVMAEERAAFDALPRAWQLARQRFWPVFFLVVLLTLLSTALIAGPQALLSGGLLLVLADAFSDASTSGIVFSSVLASVLSLLLSTIVAPVLWVGLCSLYLDLRVRFEGIDMALALDSAETPLDPTDAAVETPAPLLPTQRVAAAPAAPMPSATPQGIEWVWFLLLSVGPFLLLFAFYVLLFGILFLIVGAAGF